MLKIRETLIGKLGVHEKKGELAQEAQERGTNHLQFELRLPSPAITLAVSRVHVYKLIRCVFACGPNGGLCDYLEAQ